MSEKKSNEAWHKDEFLTMFYNDLREFARASFEVSVEFIVSPEFEYFFQKHTVPIFIMINKSIFQNLKVFLDLILDDVMIFPAFSSLRNAIEGVRLYRALFLDDELRKDYLENPNFDFSGTPDYDFMQRKINKALDNLEKDLRLKEEIPASIILWNKNLTSGSPISELHSELSKWTHLLNYNLIRVSQSSNKFYLGINNDLDTETTMSLFIRKYIEGAYLLVAHHNETIEVTKNENFRKIEMTMLKDYGEFIEKYYK